MDSRMTTADLDSRINRSMAELLSERPEVFELHGPKVGVLPSDGFIHKLSCLPNARSVRALGIEPAISGPAAKALFHTGSVLTNLEEASLSIQASDWEQETCIIERLAPSLKVLRLKLGPGIIIDLAAVARLEQLHTLDIVVEGGCLRNVASLGQCSSLEELTMDIDGGYPSSANQDVLQAAAGLRTLRRLSLPGAWCAVGDDVWQGLGASYRLRELRLLFLRMQPFQRPVVSPVHVTKLTLQAVLLRPSYLRVVCRSFMVGALPLLEKLAVQHGTFPLSTIRGLIQGEPGTRDWVVQQQLPEDDLAFVWHMPTWLERALGQHRGDGEALRCDS